MSNITELDTSAGARWSKHLPLKNPNHFAARYQLEPTRARQSQDGGAAVIPLYKFGAKAPVNLLAIKSDLSYQYLNELQIGEYSSLNNTIDPQFIIGAESYLSALVLATRFDYWQGCIVACFRPENIDPVLDSFNKSWPYIDYVAAPDTRDRSLCDGVLYPPGDLSWLDLHMWEVGNQWAI